MTNPDGFLTGLQLAVPDADGAETAAAALRAAGAEVAITADVADHLYGIHPTNIGVSVYAPDLAAANRAVSVLAVDPHLPPWPMSTRFAASPEPVVAVPAFPGMSEVVDRLGAAEARVLEFDAAHGVAELGDFEAMVIPTATRAERPGMCGVSIPEFGGVSVMSGPHHDAAALDIAAMLADVDPPRFVWPYVVASCVDLVVFGAHLRGEALDYQLTDLGARWDDEVLTAPRYRMTVLPTRPAKPGVLRVAEGESGTSLTGHRWTLSPAALGIFLAQLPPPMQLGQVELADGTWRVGFGCDASAATGPDISSYGGWLGALEAGAVD